MAFKVYMVRHGETISNKMNKNQGWDDTPLTQQGKEDARKAGRHLANICFDRAYSSDTGRAVATAELILAENKLTKIRQPKTLKYFREQYYGSFEGCDYDDLWQAVMKPRGFDDLRKFSNYYTLDQTKDIYKKEDPKSLAENHQEFWQRIKKGFAYLRAHCEDGDNVLLSSHGETIGCIVDRYSDLMKDHMDFPENGAVTKLTVGSDNIHVDYYNHYRDDQTY